MSHRCSQLILADRRHLHHFVESKVPINTMAGQLGRHLSTIYREIRHNTFHDRELPEYSEVGGLVRITDALYFVDTACSAGAMEIETDV